MQMFTKEYRGRFGFIINIHVPPYKNFVLDEDYDY